MKRDAAERRARELLEIVGLSERANAYPAELSGRAENARGDRPRAGGRPAGALMRRGDERARPQHDGRHSGAPERNQRKDGRDRGRDHARDEGRGKNLQQGRRHRQQPHRGRRADERNFHQPPFGNGAQADSSHGRRARHDGGEKLRLIFDGTSSEEPVISLLALNCGITANILYANTKDVGGRIYGEMVVRVPADGASVGKAERFLAGKGVIVKEES